MLWLLFHTHWNTLIFSLNRRQEHATSNAVDHYSCRSKHANKCIDFWHDRCLRTRDSPPSCSSWSRGTNFLIMYAAWVRGCGCSAAFESRFDPDSPGNENTSSADLYARTQVNLQKSVNQSTGGQILQAHGTAGHVASLITQMSSHQRTLRLLRDENE